MTRVVLGYSGGLEAAALVPWLAECHRAEVVALTLDLGQGGELEAVRDRALAQGAARAHVLDVRDEFAQEYVLPALRADALEEGCFPMPAALERPLIARKLVDIATMEGATAVAVGASDGHRAWRSLAGAVCALDSSLQVIAAPRAWAADRAALRTFARSRGLVAAGTTDDEVVRTDANLWGRSAVVDEAAGAAWPPSAAYRRTRAPDLCPEEPAYVEIGFDRGTPMALNGVSMGLVELVASLDAIAGGSGVGRLAPAPQEIREAPAALVLHTAHAALWPRLAPPDAGRRHHETSAAYANLIRDGSWFSQARRDLDAAELPVQDALTGTIRLRLHRGACSLVD